MPNPSKGRTPLRQESRQFATSSASAASLRLYFPVLKTCALKVVVDSKPRQLRGLIGSVAPKRNTLNDFVKAKESIERAVAIHALTIQAGILAEII